MLTQHKIRHDELGIVYKDNQFHKIIGPGKYRFLWFRKYRVQKVDLRSPVFTQHKLRDLVKADAFKGLGQVLDLRDWQRALIWKDGRFFGVLSAGLFVIWTEFNNLHVEVVDARRIRFEHEELPVILRDQRSDELQVVSVERDHTGVLFVEGQYKETLAPGRYAFWRKMGDVNVVSLDMREQAIDVNGQDLMTSDKVTLRLNAMVTYRVADPRLALSASDDIHQALYRATQLALRAIVGQHELDEFLDDKRQIAERALASLSERARELGLKVVSVGVRDVILPGEMKDLMNKVIEARKAAEANLISRREETAAIRSQANTAKLLDAHPTLMRLRELEVLEKVAQSSNLQVVLGDNDGLSDRIRRLV